jgi:hypothetical protein
MPNSNAKIKVTTQATNRFERLLIEILLFRRISRRKLFPAAMGRAGKLQEPFGPGARNRITCTLFQG